MSKTVVKSVERPWNKNLKSYKKWEAPQPTPAQKSAGRERKRQAQKMMDMILQYQTMTKSDLEKLSQNKDLTVLELLMIRYVVSGMKDNKMLIDMMDRHISKAPTEQKIEHEWNINSTIVKIWQKPQ